ncbi:MAG TPA: SurA N-terminal domain-containing protein [Candidatus Cryptobacteroides intestinipullorum]|nr:SurA N-terminal domain-containing protein [Candidatus Cryptobacteroides intestinipullorum]
MAVLEKIRVKFGILISVVIALALLSFIIDPNTISQVASSMSSKYRVGKINGNSVSYQDFDNELNYQNRIFEYMYRRNANTDQEMEYVRNMAWKTFVDRYMFLANARKAGIQVGESELVDLTSGDMVSPLISQIFVDETGAFSKDMLSNYLQSMQYDQSGQARMFWDYLQNTVTTDQYYVKYNSLFSAGDFINPLMMTNEIAENNNSVGVEFVMLPYGYQRDTTIEISDAEIKSYYKAHKKLYRQTASRDIEYVVFEVKPSKTDISDANQKIVGVYDEFSSTDNVKNFLMKNSDRQYVDEWYKKGELRTVSADIDDFVFDKANGKGAVSEVLTKDNTFYVARIMDSAMVPDSVFVKGVLLQGVQTELADSLLNVLKTGKDNLGNVAAQYSAFNNPQGEPGEYGWMTKNTMFPGLESIFTARTGSFYTVETNYGVHIIEVTDRTAPVLKKKVAILEKEALPSGNTINEYYVQANELATKSDGKYENFKKTADEEGLAILTRNNLREGEENIGSINDRTKEVSKWAYEAREGKVSNVLNINNDYYIVAALKKVHKDGYTPVAEAASGIRSILYNQKLGEKKAAEVASKIEGLGSMEAIAEALGTSVSTREGISFSSYMNQGLDPKFIGAVSVAEEGVISAPLAGTIGVYVYKVTSHDTGASFTEDDVKNRAAQMAYYESQSLLPVMMQDADVEDNRARFF